MWGTEKFVANVHPISVQQLEIFRLPCIQQALSQSQWLWQWHYHLYYQTHYYYHWFHLSQKVSVVLQLWLGLPLGSVLYNQVKVSERTHVPRRPYPPCSWGQVAQFSSWQRQSYWTVIKNQDVMSQFYSGETDVCFLASSYQRGSVYSKERASIF